MGNVMAWLRRSGASILPKLAEAMPNVCVRGAAALDSLFWDQVRVGRRARRGAPRDRTRSFTPACARAQEMEIAILGLQNAGKSTFVQVLNVSTGPLAVGSGLRPGPTAAGVPADARRARARQTGEFQPEMIPTVGFNMHKLQKGKVTCRAAGGDAR